MTRQHEITTINGELVEFLCEPHQTLLDALALTGSKERCGSGDCGTRTGMLWQAGNLCRRTGYDKIVRAVMDAAAEMRGARP